jgi:uncharacterized protein YuzE
MKYTQYFHDTDTLYLVLNDNPVSETRDLDEKTIIDLDETGEIVRITFEHASVRTDIANFSLQQIAMPAVA